MARADDPRLSSGMFAIGLAAAGLAIPLIAQPGNGFWGVIGWSAAGVAVFSLLGAALLRQPPSSNSRPKLVVEPAFAQAFANDVGLISLEIYNDAKSGATARGVVPTLEGHFEAKVRSDDPPRGDLMEGVWRRDRPRAHGSWINDPFGTQARPGAGIKAARRRDFAPTGERERLGIATKKIDEDEIFLLNGAGGQNVLRLGKWRVTLTLRGDDLPEPVSATLLISNYGKGSPVLAELVKEVRRFGIGPKRTKVLASTAVRFPSLPKWWQRGLLANGTAPSPKGS